MCGFVGCLAPDGNTPRVDLNAWSAKIRHRGPDQAGSVIDKNFGIGTRRLSILDLSHAGDQPMESERYVLGFNGEIYNHHDLRSELVSGDNAKFVSSSDTETVLRAIERWGIHDALSRLNGMYAVAVWDKHTSELTLARDPLGIKPIFYIRNSEGFFFASEIKALLEFSTKELNRDGVGLYFYFGFVPAPFTLVKGINKVKPGECRVFRQDREERSEMILPMAWKHASPPASTWIERVHQVRTHVEEAVQRQLLSDVPVGVFLSGGIDSTIIANVAARQKYGLASFSLNPESTARDPRAKDDAELASKVARSLGLSHREVPFAPVDVFDRLESLIGRIDEPVAELYAFGEMILSERARSEGVNVVLTGHGADEVFLGYPTYNAVFRGDLYNKIPFFGPAARLAARSSAVSQSTRTNLLGAASVWRKAPLDRYETVSGVHFCLYDAAIQAGVEPERLRTIVSEILDQARSRARLLPRADGECNAELFARMDTFLMVPEHYNTRLDRMTMSASIEARVPLQDLDLIGFVSQLSHRDLLRGGLKGMFRYAFKDILPPEIANRPKQTFQAPMLSWVTGPLAPWMNKQLSRPEARLSSASQRTALLPATTKHAYQAWSIALLEGWRYSMGLDYS
jgi:asparagine synthase (glutamine-hydrolysing)